MLSNRFILPLLFLLSLGCNSARHEDKVNSVKLSIAKYNQTIIEVHKNRSYKMLKRVATEDEGKRIMNFIESFFQGDQTMEAELHKLDFKEVNIDGNKATARTSEDWSYKWITVRTKEVAEPLKHVSYEIVYHLNRWRDGWLVDKVEEVNTAITDAQDNNSGLQSYTGGINR